MRNAWSGTPTLEQKPRRRRRRPVEMRLIGTGSSGTGSGGVYIIGSCELQGNIRVFVRVRPALTVGSKVSSDEAVSCPPSRANSSGDEVEVPEEVAFRRATEKARTFRFAYDRVLGPRTDQINWACLMGEALLPVGSRWLQGLYLRCMGKPVPARRTRCSGRRLAGMRQTRAFYNGRWA